MSDAKATTPLSGVEVLQTRLWQAAQDLATGRITPTEANRISRQAGRQIREIEAALRAAKLAQKLRTA